MQITDVPPRFNIPFANSAGGGYIRAIPEASQIGIQDGAASLTTGFPPLNFLPVGAGGVPPFGQDFNGVLKQITQWNQWQGAGGTATYNSDFATAIGGYPKNALIMGTSGALVYQNLVDSNTTNPESGGTNWTPLATASALQNGTFAFATATGSGNALVAAFSPALTSAVAGLSIRVAITADNTGTATLNAGYGVQPILTRMGLGTPPGFLRTGAIVEFIDNGSGSFIAVSGAGGVTGTSTDTWYHVGADGFVTQGGKVNEPSSTSGTVTIPTPFQNYVVSAQVWNVAGTTGDAQKLMATNTATLNSIGWFCMTAATPSAPNEFLWSAAGY